jgi:hypothetical protein
MNAIEPFCPSNAPAIGTGLPASVSGSPCRVAPPKPWGGSLEADDTPGGGLTMDLGLVTAPHHEPAPEPAEATT